jgi:NADPH:quinone reductase-like Zn-dependent oxidoreductase
VIAYLVLCWLVPYTQVVKTLTVHTFCKGVHSLSPRVGAFAEYVGGMDAAVMKIPDFMSFEQASSLGVGLATVGLALFHVLQVPGYPDKPAAEPKTVLVYGGSTATGTLALQLLKL